VLRRECLLSTISRAGSFLGSMYGARKALVWGTAPGAVVLICRVYRIPFAATCQVVHAVLVQDPH
jgi:hypothetical protein